ncbi:MAG: transglycosylase SLT domain-containing protein [Rhodospirillaceae bacterium]|nr:transglycosylase SLT domain-containing protein [Rhodospirillaceae bacterium]
MVLAACLVNLGANGPAEAQNRAKTPPIILPHIKPAVPAPSVAPSAPSEVAATVPTEPRAINGVLLPLPKPPVPARVAGAPTPRGGDLGRRAEGPFLTPAERDLLREALRAAADGRRENARNLARRISKPIAGDLVEWLSMRSLGARIGFAERVAFLTTHGDWPAANELRRQAEDVAAETGADAAVVDWFIRTPPLTTKGKMAFARAARATGNESLAVSVAKEAWIKGSFSRTEERDFVRAFGAILTPDDHRARLEELLYAEKRAEAERFLARVDKDAAAVAKVRIALMGSAGNVDRMIAQLPTQLRDDPGIVYDRIKWRRRKDREDDARALLPAFKDSYPRPDLWWKEREILARDLMEKNRPQEAYTIVKNHGALDAVSLADAEWLAGWIALRFLNDGEAALVHFEKVYDTVQLGANLARSAYWVGRAAEHLGRPDIADEWYRRAATHITSFYGQLAAARLKTPPVPTLPVDPAPSTEERAKFEAARLTQAVRALADLGSTPYLRPFLLALAASSDFAVDRAMAAELAARLGRPDIGVWISRQAARDRIPVVTHGYPVPAVNVPTAPEKALVLAVIRQESNFDPAAESSAGALGLMQLMPATARAVSGALGQRYSREQLTDDPAYNMRLGSTYLNALVNEFDGSYVLAIAGYNAGPARSRQWIKRFGDPRDVKVDAVDWIEQIPFNETRNYVQRVLENMMVYRAVLANSPAVGQELEQVLKNGPVS